LPLTIPRTDAPTTLQPVATPDPPLTCERDDASTQDRLLMHRSELRLAQHAGTYRDRRVAEYPVPRSQIPFLGIALRRALDGTEYADRVQWIADFNAIRTGVDAAIFMTDAKLKVQYGLDMKKVMRESQKKLRRTQSAVKW